MMHRSRLLLWMAVMIVGAAPLGAQQLQEEVVADLDGVHRKVVALAEAVPEAMYAWRPAEGVRSLGEVLMHAAAGNYVILDRIGSDVPAEVASGWLREPNAVTDKETVVEIVDESFRFAKEAILATPTDELWQQAVRAGPGTTVANQVLLTLTHAHEHLGQLIAYVRVNGIAPPWSR